MTYGHDAAPWSLNGLETETGRDRRTLGKILSTIPPDGHLAKDPAWYLMTVLSAIDNYENPVPSRRAGVSGRDAYIEAFVSRAREWRQIRKEQTGGYGRRIPFVTAASMFTGGDGEALLTWLRAGMPFAKEGDWETGDGFVLVAQW